MHLQVVSLSSLSIEASICTRLSSYLPLNKTYITALGQALHQGYLRKTVRVKGTRSGTRKKGEKGDRGAGGWKRTGLRNHIKEN